MPQNKTVAQYWTNRNLAAAAVLKAKPGTLLSVVCIAAGTIDIINDITTGGGGSSFTGFPATMTKGQVLPVDLAATVGITAKTVSGGGIFNVTFS